MILSFTDIKEQAQELALMIMKSGFQPDYIVGVARGGWIPARLLSDTLNVKRLLSVGIKYSDDMREMLEIYAVPDPFPRNKNILLVEDCLESGKSLDQAAHLFLDKNPDTRTASFFITEGTSYFPNYYVKKLHSAPLFPWE